MFQKIRELHVYYDRLENGMQEETSFVTTRSMIRNITKTNTAVSGVSLKVFQKINSGKSDSGIWSRHTAERPGDSPRRLLMKLETRSPAMDAAAKEAPTVAGYPNGIAPTAVTSTEAITPRNVLEGPNQGLPSTNTMPPSIGRASRRPNSKLMITGAPLANTSNSSILLSSAESISR